MKSNKKKQIVRNEEEDDYIIDNDQEILDYQNNININNKPGLNKNNKSPKSSNRNQAGNWIKEAKAKYQKEKNVNKNNTNKIDSKIENNNRKPKKIINFDDIPVGGGMGGGMVGGGDFSVEIRVPPKKNNYTQNNSFVENNNIQFRNEKNLKKNLDNKTDYTKPKRNNNNIFFEENNNNNNFEPVEMERKSSMVSMITQTCDKEMLGRSEFIGIPINQNSNEINFSSNNDRLNTNNKTNYSLYDKQESFSKVSNNNYTNKISDFNSSQNLREKTESAIQLQNVQRELDNEIEMNKRLQGQIENYKSEFNNLREELVIKSDIINELQQKISKLEKELFLQRNQLIEAEAKPSQEHYEDIINNYENMKKNFDKAIERIKYLSDENAELKERLMRYEENNKKVKKETRYDKDKINIVNDKRNKRIKYIEKQENKDEEEEENQNEIEEENLYEEQDINPVSKNKKQIEEKNENEEEMPEINKQEKNSIIPEDNDIFGTKNYEKRNIRKPRKIQEDGIPVIKRMEERDNVKDIMVNNYAANDDVYYNRPPIGKPKVKRIKRNNNELDNNLSNFQEQNINTKGSKEFKKINIDYNNDKSEEESKNNDKNDILNENEYNRSKNMNIINRRKNNLNNITTNVGVFPSQIKTIENEREILNLESQLFNLQKERDLVNDEYLKYPEYPKKREEINAKRKIEMKLEEMNKEISLQKLKIRELKGKK
jgi:hypothetical protein